jgi:hypothetical protein
MFRIRLGATEGEGGGFEVGFFDDDGFKAEVPDALFGEDDWWNRHGGKGAWSDQQGDKQWNE